MRWIFFIGTTNLMILAGCAMNPRAGINPFTSYGSATPYAEFGCSAKDKDGHCLQATCKADAQSNCDDWAAGCLRNDGYLKGSSEGGTCTKIL